MPFVFCVFFLLNIVNAFESGAVSSISPALVTYTTSPMDNILAQENPNKAAVLYEQYINTLDPYQKKIVENPWTHWRIHQQFRKAIDQEKNETTKEDLLEEWAMFGSQYPLTKENLNSLRSVYGHPFSTNLLPPQKKQGLTPLPITHESHFSKRAPRPEGIHTSNLSAEELDSLTESKQVTTEQIIKQTTQGITINSSKLVTLPPVGSPPAFCNTANLPSTPKKCRTPLNHGS